MRPLISRFLCSKNFLTCCKRVYRRSFHTCHGLSSEVPSTLWSCTFSIFVLSHILTTFYPCWKTFWVLNYGLYIILYSYIRTHCWSQNLLPQPKRIFSGIQPTGTLHLGNYFGAVQQWINLQRAGEQCTYCLVDMHAITQHQVSKVSS